MKPWRRRVRVQHAAAVIDDYTKSADVGFATAVFGISEHVDELPNLLPEILPVDAAEDGRRSHPSCRICREALHNERGRMKTGR
jgi:hypothetical protein